MHRYATLLVLALGCSSSDDAPSSTLDAGVDASVDAAADAAAPCAFVEGAKCSTTGYVGVCRCSAAAEALPSDRVVACCRDGVITLSLCSDGIFASSLCNGPDAGAPDVIGDTSGDATDAD